MQSNALFDELLTRKALVKNPENPTLAERELLWTKAVEAYRSALLAGHKKGAAVKVVAAWLWEHLRALGESHGALTRQLYRKLKAVSAGATLEDKRASANQTKRAPTLSDADRAALLNEGLHHCGCMVDFTWQECLRKKLLSAAILERYPAPSRRRPTCPRAIRRIIAPLLNALRDTHIRPHHQSNNLAPMTRDWSNVFAQDIYECDDKTLDVCCRIISEENGMVTQRKSRCQFLPMIDAKSGKVLEFVLIGEANYNAVSIRTLIKKTCLKYGLPADKFYFERGIWKSSRMLGNNAKSKPFAEVENFATRCGIRIGHASPGRARSKIVETVLRLLDRRMYGLTGYVGRDEQHFKYERVQKLMTRMDASDYDPERDGQLLTFDELMDCLAQAVQEYNNTKSESRVKGGYFSPNETWENCRRKTPAGDVEPVAMLTPEFEYLLAAHSTTVKAQIDGVKIRLGKQVFHFHNPGMVDLVGGFVGRETKVWFDPEFPETAVATNLSETEFFPLVRMPDSPANARTGADWSLFAKASEPYRAAKRQIRQLYSDLKKTYVAPARPIVAHAVAIEKAERMGEAQKQASRLSTSADVIANFVNPPGVDREARRKDLEDLRQQTAHLFL